ncbi:preprotein translocase subunit Sec61beta [Candidatus Woesearchaeota archaeon]|nr:preprotein translocase subunit Sec61beta [Candidatus Woesearchaeota archaeon]RLE43688.1 MAG: preprotein translocase subunit Sec61beta [Candidatus Woesearchaeota archaeon]
MARNNKIFMPSSQGGLIRYFDEERTRFRLKPGHVVILIGALVVLEVLLHIL